LAEPGSPGGGEIFVHRRHEVHNKESRIRAEKGEIRKKRKTEEKKKKIIQGKECYFETKPRAAQKKKDLFGVGWVVIGLGWGGVGGVG